MAVLSFGPRFQAAVELTTQHFDGRCRGNTRVPAVAHALAVGALAAEIAASEDEVIGALLHDVVEDGGGREALAQIRDRFGETVARHVEELSDQLEPDDRTWRERKADDLATYGEKLPGSLRIALCDKTDNLRTLVQKLRRDGPGVFEQHSAGSVEAVAWYYAAVARGLRGRADELGSGAQEMLGELEAHAGELTAACAPATR